MSIVSGSAAGQPTSLEAWCRAQFSATPLAEAFLHRARNVLFRATSPDGREVVVKRFGRSLVGLLGDRLRGSKARRSFLIAAELQRRGLATPAPLAWAEQQRWVTVTASCYVCAAIEDARQLHHWLRAPGADWRRQLIGAGRAIAAMHLAGVHHRDLSPGNLVWGRVGQAPATWYLVDLNRIVFGTVPDPQEGAALLARLAGARPGRMEALLAGYAATRGTTLAQVRAAWRVGRRRWRSRDRLPRLTRRFRHRLRRQARG